GANAGCGAAGHLFGGRRARTAPVSDGAPGAKRFAAPAEWNLVNRNVSQNPTISQRQAIFVIDLKIKLMK
ncbi:hypothetical protein, partial [Burkholderia pseudomallei]|uniref:hypothetical protein n=1 Tax=Burkholderia pseudomallei TaxID=28450 RepID=UPI00126776C5